jgi:UDP-2,3-diacylglucosamine hydrolase
MNAIFIADAHLTGRRDKNQIELVDFLQTLNRDSNYPESIFILGDLFEFWIGENLVALYEYWPVIEMLKTLRMKGWKIAYIEGNHDFFLDPLLSKEIGINIYPNSADIYLDGRKVYLAHGDAINFSNLGYRLLRLFLHNRIILHLANRLPAGLVWKIAYHLAHLSRNHHYLPDKNPLRPAFIDFARTKTRKGFDFIILAHSHQAEILPLQSQGKTGIYANPGDWVESRSYLKWNSSSLELCHFRK